MSIVSSSQLANRCSLDNVAAATPGKSTEPVAVAAVSEKSNKSAATATDPRADGVRLGAGLVEVFRMLDFHDADGELSEAFTKLQRDENRR